MCCGAKNADKLAGIVRPHLAEGDEEPGFFSVFVAFARYLRASLERLVALDEKVYAANVLLGRLRDERLTAFSVLARTVARLRLTLINQFVAPRLDDLGLEAETARTPVPLLRQADRMVEVFAGDDVTELLGQPVFEHPVDPRPQAAELRPLAGDLRRNLDQFDDTQRAFDEAKVEKDKVMKEHDLLYLRTARPFEDFCRLVGEDELADRVRLTARRTRQAQQGSEGPASDDGTAEDEALEAESSQGSSNEDGAVDPPVEVSEEAVQRSASAEPANDDAST